MGPRWLLSHGTILDCSNRPHQLINAKRSNSSRKTQSGSCCSILSIPFHLGRSSFEDPGTNSCRIHNSYKRQRSFQHHQEDRGISVQKAGVDQTWERDDSLEMLSSENLKLVGGSFVSSWKCPTNRGSLHLVRCTVMRWHIRSGDLRDSGDSDTPNT